MSKGGFGPPIWGPRKAVRLQIWVLGRLWASNFGSKRALGLKFGVLGRFVGKNGYPEGHQNRCRKTFLPRGSRFPKLFFEGYANYRELYKLDFGRKIGTQRDPKIDAEKHSCFEVLVLSKMLFYLGPRTALDLQLVVLGRFGDPGGLSPPKSSNVGNSAVI